MIEFSNGIIETAKRPREKTKDGGGKIQTGCDSGPVEPAGEAVDQTEAPDKAATLSDKSATELKENQEAVIAQDEVTESEKPDKMSAESEVVDKEPAPDAPGEVVD